MSAFPDFATLPFDGAAAATGAAKADPWTTPEGIAVRSAYGADDGNGFPAMGGFPVPSPYVSWL